MSRFVETLYAIAKQAEAEGKPLKAQQCVRLANSVARWNEENEKTVNTLEDYVALQSALIKEAMRRLEVQGIELLNQLFKDFEG